MKYAIIIFTLLIFASCSNNWLDEKSDSSLVVPTSLKDLQAILDRDGIMNYSYPVLGDLATDDYYLSNSVWSTSLVPDKNTYIWADDVFEGGGTDNWRTSYLAIFYANAALEGLTKIPVSENNIDTWNNIQGSALFFRSFALYTLAQLFTKPYDSSTAQTDLGLVLRNTTDVNHISVRSTLTETYEQIIKDLIIAKEILPVSPLYKVRPSKPAAYALLARTHLTMGNYNDALSFADSCLSLYDTLIDYNSLNLNSQFPIPFLNDEVIFQSQQATAVFAANNYFVDTLLYKSYHENDIRRQAFYRDNKSGGFNFIGSYMGGGSSAPGNVFGGIATDEIFLIRAECNARLGNVEAAMNDLNTLLYSRWEKGTFDPLIGSDSNDALKKVLVEKRKETPFRGLRWIELRRLNKEPQFQQTLTRVIDGQTYTLPPNDPRYVFPIPQSVIDVTGIPQN